MNAEDGVLWVVEERTNSGRWVLSWWGGPCASQDETKAKDTLASLGEEEIDARVVKYVRAEE